jgi:hypothetical protein
MAITAGTVALVVVVALMLIPGGPDAFATLFHHDTLAAPVSGNTGSISVENGAPWGKFTVDNHPVDLVRLIEGAQALHLAVGQHTLVYTAAPFAPLHCQISVPAQQSDTCPISSPPVASSDMRVIDLGSSPLRLTAAQYGRFVRAVNSALTTGTSSALVTAGEQYLDASGTPVTATEPLHAKLTYTLDPQPDYTPTPPWPIDACTLICKRHDLVVPGKNQTAWVLVARAHARWSYTTSSGTTFSAPAAPATVGSDVLLDVIAWWHDGWHAALNPTDPQRASCSIANVYARHMRVVDAKGMGLEVVPAANDASGCVVEAVTYVSHSARAPDIALYVYRFGVLLAANEVARRNTPDVPRADAAARRLVTHLAP